MVLEGSESNKTDSSLLAEMTRELGPAAYRAIFDRVAMAHEVWLYDQPTKRFHAWKNKGHANEIIARMAESGINVKVSAARLDRGTASEMQFCDDKDEFLFKLKYL